MIGYIYRITIVKEDSSLNMYNYIGLHTNTNFNDNYFGSGKIIKDFRKKYGTKYFHKEILDYSNDINELSDLEQYYITMEIHNPKNLNIIYGGGLGNKIAKSSNIGRKLSNESIQKMKETKKRNPRVVTEEERTKKSFDMLGEKNHMYGVNVKDIMDEEQYCQMLLKRSISMKGKMSEDKNPMFNNKIKTEDIINLYDNGKSINEISEILECSYSLVYKRLKKLGRNTKKNIVDKEKVIHLYHKGVPIKKIAVQMGCTRDNIYHIIKSIKNEDIV